MARALAKSSKHAAATQLTADDTRWRGLTRIAFVIMLALVVVRATISESATTEFMAIPGSVAAPSTPGPASALTLDLLFCFPAMLVLARRLIDNTYALRFGKSHAVMFLLALWTVLSVFWASDKFLAAVSASNWVSGLILLWAASQLVHTWMRLRIVAAAAFGVLLVLLVQGYYYRFVDLPDLRAEWAKHRSEMLGQRGTEAGSFEDRQIGVNIESGEVTGFSLSRNTYAAVLVLLGIISAGAAVQRLADKDPFGWAVPVFLALALAMLMLYRFVESKTAYATPFIGAGLLIWIGSRRQWIASHARKLYMGGVSLFVLGIAAVIGHGLRHGNLVQASLTFRWQYWVGAARLFIHHSWLGVGWANFGDSYLAYRLPQAIESPKDPHNFLIRAFVELGVLGGILMLAWILRLWWEFTQLPIAAPPPMPAKDNRSDHRIAMIFLIGLPLVGIGLSAVVAIDWSQRWAWVVLELFKRAMFLIALLAGLGIVSMRSLSDQRLDDRPAPWIFWSILVAVGLFLIHNLIDFSLFEPGPLALFALLAGSALGMRLPRKPRAPAGTAVAVAGFVLAGVAWLVGAAAGAWNVALAENLCQDAEQQVREGNPTSALQKLIDANRLVPINPEYPFHAALISQKNTLMVRDMLMKAVDANPMSAHYRRVLAQFELTDKDPAHALADYDTAVTLDPNNMNQRIEYAEALIQNGQPGKARVQYQRTLELNDALPASEPQRLPQGEVNAIRARLNAH